MLRFLTPTPFNVDDFLIQINILLLLTGGGMRHWVCFRGFLSTAMYSIEVNNSCYFEKRRNLFINS